MSKKLIQSALTDCTHHFQKGLLGYLSEMSSKPDISEFQRSFQSGQKSFYPQLCIAWQDIKTDCVFLLPCLHLCMSVKLVNIALPKYVWKTNHTVPHLFIFLKAKSTEDLQTKLSNAAVGNTQACEHSLYPLPLLKSKLLNLGYSPTLLLIDFSQTQRKHF